jgi:hypothetical protein
MYDWPKFLKCIPEAVNGVAPVGYPASSELLPNLPNFLP